MPAVAAPRLPQPAACRRTAAPAQHAPHSTAAAPTRVGGRLKALTPLPPPPGAATWRRPVPCKKMAAPGAEPQLGRAGSTGGTAWEGPSLPPSGGEGARNQRPAAVPLLRPGLQGLCQQTPARAGGRQQPQPRAQTSRGAWVQIGLGNSPGDGVESSSGGLPLPWPRSPAGRGQAGHGLFTALGHWGPEQPRSDTGTSAAWTGQSLPAPGQSWCSATPQPLFSFNFSVCSEPESLPCRSGATLARLAYLCVVASAFTRRTVVRGVMQPGGGDGNREKNNSS